MTLPYTSQVRRLIDSYVVAFAKNGILNSGVARYQARPQTGAYVHYPGRAENVATRQTAVPRGSRPGRYGAM